jgi:hypothetical protein
VAHISIHNNSLITYEPGEFVVGIEAPYPYTRTDPRKFTTTILPDGDALHMYNDFDTLFPDAYTSFDVVLSAETDNVYDDHFDVIIRVYTAAGTREFPLRFSADSVPE